MAVKKINGHSYKSLHKALPKMTEQELRDAMQAEINAKQPRADMLARLVGRFNRLRGARCTKNVLGLMAYRRRKKNVNAALDSDR